MSRGTRGQRRRRATAAIIALASLIVIASAASAQQADHDHHEQPTKRLRPVDAVKNAKLDTSILRVSRAATTASPGAAIAVAESANLDVEQNKVRVVLQTTDAAIAGQAVAAVGGIVEASASGLVQALIPPAALAPLGQISVVRYVRAPFHPQIDAVAGEGAAAVGAPAWHTLGRKGGGTKVAIIDLGFEGIAASQASGDLPASLTTVDYCGGLANGQPHGVAVAEIVHEVAPDAELTLICVDSEVTLAQAEAYVEANGIKIVNHSVAWFNTSRGDGKGGAGSPDAIVAKARAAGVLWVNAAGNSAEDHWSGTFRDTDGDNFHNFAANDFGNTFFVPNGGVACVTLKWDAWPTTSQDYDLYLARSSDGALFSWSTNLQSGSQAPTEEACLQNNTGNGDWFFAAIDRFGASATPRFDMFTFGDAFFLEYAQAAGSINELAASPNALAAAAICYQNNALEPFSSRGPTIDNRVKPDIAGQDGVSSSVYGVSTGTCGPDGFYGTSAASPHTAGVAALILGQTPSLSVSQLQNTIIGAAQDLGPGGKDNSFGAGKLRLPAINAPKITSFTPGSGPVGAIVTVNGSSLAGTNHIDLGGVDAVISGTPTASQAKFVVPPASASGQIHLTTPDGSVTSAATFKVTPKLVSLSTPSGIRGSEVVITGTTFTGATLVRFNGVNDPGFVVDNDSQITAHVPVTATSGNIQITTAAGTSNTLPFTVVLPPSVSGLAPNFGPVGTLITVNGANLGGSTNVTFNGTNATPTNVTNGSLKAAVPAGAQTGIVQVTNPAGTGGTLTFKVTPKILSLSTPNGIRGSTVVITGTTFTSATTVKFNGAVSTFTVDNDSQITATIPATATSGNIQVTTPAGSSNNVAFTVILPPTVSGLSPNSGPVGTVVQVNGSYLSTASKVTFGDKDASPTNLTNGSLKAVVPADSQTGVVTVTNPGGVGGALTFKVTPRIASLSAPSGVRGSSVVLTGTTFTGATLVRFNGVSASFSVDNDSQITATVPNTATTGNIQVTTPAGTSNNLPFIVVLPPSVSGLAPNFGPVGTLITVNGANLGGSTNVTFNGTSASPTNVTNGSLKAAVPAGAQIGIVQVTNPAGTGGTLTFKVTPKILSLSTPNGIRGSTVVITGTTFTSATTVKFNGAVSTFTVDNDSQITATIPATATSGNIQVTTPSGGSNNTPFTVILPPTVSGLSPNSGPVGTVVQVNGSYLSTASKVTFGDKDASPTNLTNGSLKAVVPADSQTGVVTVTNPGGVGGALTFKVTPKILTLSTPSGIRGSEVVITGTTFTGATLVRFNGVNDPGFVVDNDSQITAHVPVTATSGNIQITTAAGTSNTLPFTVVLPPSVSGLAPNFGPVGTLITVNGANLGGATNVTFNGTNATPTNVTNGSLKAAVPAGAQTGIVQVTNPAGTGGTLTFKVTPKILSLSTPNGIRGSTVVITGTTFTSATTVKFNGAVSTFTVDNDSQITATIPATATSGNIQVTTPAGSSNNTPFTVILPPTISGFAPSSGTDGTVVTINGAGFSPGAVVRFNGVQSTTVTIVGVTRIQAVVPLGTTTGRIAVETSAGGVQSAQSFTIPLSITSVTPVHGYPGEQTVIRGVGFSNVTSLKLGDITASFETVSDAELRAIVPDGAVDGPIVVGTGLTKAQSPKPFTIDHPAVTSFSPPAGPVGTIVTILGSDLRGVTAIRFGTASATFATVSDTQIDATVPLGAASGPIALYVGSTPTLTDDLFTAVSVPVPGDRIVFSALPNSTINVMNGDGTGRTLIANVNATHPQWSPDGSKIAYSDTFIRVMNADGTGTAAVMPGFYPSWSPDGKKVVVDLGHSDYIVSLDNVDQWFRLNPPDESMANPRWSSDGNWILYEKSNPPVELRIISPDGLTVRTVATSVVTGYGFDWTRDGNIAYLMPGKIRIVDTNGTLVRDLTAPYVSPNGFLSWGNCSRIVYRGPFSDVGVALEDGTGYTTIANDVVPGDNVDCRAP